MDQWLTEPEGDALPALQAFLEGDEVRGHDEERMGCLLETSARNSGTSILDDVFWPRQG